MIPPQKFREIVFQLLYSRDMGQTPEEVMIPFLSEELSVPDHVIAEAQVKVKAILEKQESIDALIAKVSQSYALERIHRVERNVLRLAIFELLYDPLIPPKVAISEAIRLSKKFSTPESASFINALLDTIHKSSL